MLRLQDCKKQKMQEACQVEGNTKENSDIFQKQQCLLGVIVPVSRMRGVSVRILTHLLRA